MTWILLALAVLLASVALLASVGALLPVAHAAARRIRLQQPAEAVFALIADPAAGPRWRQDLKSVALLPPRDGRRCHRELSRFGPMDLLIEREDPPRELVQRIVTEGSPFGGTWTFRLSPLEGGGTELTITENGLVHNVFFRALSRLWFGHTATIDGYLKALAAHFGEPAAVPSDAEPEPPPLPLAGQ